ncbi:acetyl-CoA carboxylase biotin carboxyl carrier protein [Salinibacillus kushneri]|uniref:Biotin carboxyl carrier protein of acetyl-CoA carboxylase n=1 Tax=Salinibacillus kushneri TaxID=237682 RepID=A0A1I0FSI4_9BACI|nr:acetyl-CoA carboxylase biotin carboxyl carrier protein [Salinibacillus kushneri]SET61172.1 acetyl-CoA carboxylase biotin carboxyl carrier protein [Salinibacillus kushneri]
MLKVQEIRELIKLIDESSINEFSYEADGTKLNLKKQMSAEQVSQPVVIQKETDNQELAKPKKNEPVVAETQVDAKNEEKQSSESDNEETAKDYDEEITAPMVGTFYSSPSPDKDSYVQVGDKITSDSVVCIVEAMKLFNEIEAEVSGEIVDILVEDGELVEYGQPLFRVKSK